MKTADQILELATSQWLSEQLSTVDERITVACEQVSAHTAISKTVIYEHAKGTRSNRVTMVALYYYFQARSLAPK